MFRNIDEAAGYLGGMIDGEGSVWFRPDVPNGPGRGIEVANTEPSIIAATEEACRVLGIEYRVVAYEKEKTSSWKQVYRLLITGRPNYERVQQLVPIRCDRKREKLNASIAAYIDKPPAPTAEQLRRWYWDEGLSVEAIANRLDRAVPTINHWMRRAGIPRRTRQDAALRAYASGRKTTA